MSTGHESCLSREVHSNVEYHMAADFLKAYILCSVVTSLLRRQLIVVLEGNHNFFHLFLDCLPPKISAGLFINLEGFPDRMRESNSILVVCLPIPTLHLRDDAITSSQRLRHPPLEGRLFLYTIRNGIFGKLYGVRILQVFQRYPVRATITPLTQ